MNDYWIIGLLKAVMIFGIIISGVAILASNNQIGWLLIVSGSWQVLWYYRQDGKSRG